MPGVQRAQRFSVATPMLWRPRGLTEWLEATSLNASQSGVLFRADRLVEVGTEVELIFGLSWDVVDNLELADVMCFARIVRAEADEPSAPDSRLAARIDSYSFIRFTQQL
jgi:hypothetical protein